MRDCLQKNEFEALFWEEVRQNKHLCYYQAYEIAEKKHFQTFKRRKYSSYDSFRVCRDRKTKH
jgi:hypothetical protein